MRTRRGIVELVLGAAVAMAAAGCATAERDQPAPAPAQEVTSGGARLRGGGMRMDVVLGRPLVQKRLRAPGVVAKPASVVVP